MAKKFLTKEDVAEAFATTRVRDRVVSITYSRQVPARIVIVYKSSLPPEIRAALRSSK